MKTKILMRVGRYALLKRETTYTPYIVACGYDDTNRTWAAAYYFSTCGNALKDFADRASNYCADCEYIDAGCTYCKK